MNWIPLLPEDVAIKVKFSSNVATQVTKNLFLNENSADFRFVFDSDSDQPLKLPVHKIILSAVSSVFHTMFYGSLKEMKEVEIADVSFEAFKEFLQFFYLADVTLSMEHIAGVMYLGEKYEINHCLERCSSFLMQNLTENTVCLAYQLATLFKREELIESCNMVIKSKTSDVLQSKCFLACDQKLLRSILKLYPLSCTNSDLFNGFIAWAKSACQRNDLDDDQPQNIRTQLGQALYELPFATFTQAEFFNIITPNVELFEKDEIAELIKMVASTEFQPIYFAKKKRIIRSKESIQPNQNGIFECSRIIPYSFLIKDIETTTFSTNTLLLLKGFSCANVFKFKNWTYYTTEFPTSKITIAQKTGNKFENEKPILFEGEIKLVTHGNIEVELPSPILIKPGIKYEICLQQEVPPSHYTFATLKSVLHLGQDIEIRFHSDDKLRYDDTATGLITGLSVERDLGD